MRDRDRHREGARKRGEERIREDKRG